MLAVKVLLAALIVAASATSHRDDRYFASLLKRQAPGTPSYNCHDNCGTAITLSRQPNVCSNPAFRTNYANCLQCSGPDNYDIWRMYGRKLSTVGASCSLSTEPLAGKQDDVGPAMHASASASGAVESTTASTTAAASVASGIPFTTVVVSRSMLPSSITSTLVPNGSASGTASSSSSAPVQQSTNAGADVAPVGVIGAIALGAMVVF